MRAWRRQLRERYRDECEFLDPTDQLVQAEGQPYEVVRRDIAAIEQADGILANMWRESIGTAMGIVIARNKGKPVVVADPNRLRSRVLAYYADAVEYSLDGALRTLCNLLRDRHIDFVVKKGTSTRQRFDLRRLRESIRRACHAAGKDDVLVPVELVSSILELLKPRGSEGQRWVATSDIRDAVWEALASMEADPLRSAEVSGIREAWERHERSAKGTGLAHRPAAQEGVSVADRPLDVPVKCGKAHHCIWGPAVSRLGDLPPAPRKIFQEICRVPGIGQIRITKSAPGPTEGSCSVELRASKTPGVIEGKCFDPKGKRGQLQMFQIRIPDHARTEAIREALVTHLRALGLLRHRVR